MSYHIMSQHVACHDYRGIPTTYVLSPCMKLGKLPLSLLEIEMVITFTRRQSHCFFNQLMKVDETQQVVRDIPKFYGLVQGWRNTCAKDLDAL